MRKLVRLSLATALALSGAGGCSNFLSTDKVKLDPNNPSTATAGQLFVAVQAGQFAQQEGVIALIGCMWIQQCTRTSNFLQTLEQYKIASEDTPSPAFSAIYASGGLVDIKQIEAAELAAGDKQNPGIAQVWGAPDMAAAPEPYGDAPHRAAPGGAPTP